MKQMKSPRAMMVISMTIFGTLGLFVRNISLPSGEIALYRAVLAAALIGIFLLVTRQKLPLADMKKELPLLLLSGVAMGFNWILLFEAYKYTTISVATLSYYFAPVIVTVVCPILFKEKMGKKQWLCFAMSTLGIILITGLGDLSGSDQHIVGILLALGAACLYATVVLLNKFIKNVEGIHRTLLQFVAAIAVLVPYVFLTGGTSIVRLDSIGWGCLLTVGLVHTGVAYCMYFSALRDVTGQKAAILSYIDPLVAVLVSVVIMREPLTWLQILGGMLILGFTLWNEISPSRK